VKGIHGTDDPTPAASLAPIAVYQMAEAGGMGVGVVGPEPSEEWPPHAVKAPNPPRITI